MGRAWAKFRLLLWKNWLLQKRHRKQSIIEIVVPVVFSLLLVIIRTLVDVEIVTGPTVFHSFSPLHFPKHNLTFSDPTIDINISKYLSCC